MHQDKIGPSEAHLASLLALVQNGRVAEAISQLEANPNPMEAAVAFSELSRQTYRQLRNVSSMVALSNAGVQFALAKAASSANSADAAQFRKYAKILAFNTAANCWPGWDEDGIEITKEHLQSGLQLAALSRDLVVELIQGHQPLGTAHWLIGALTLAMGQSADAFAEFQRATDEFQAASDSDCVLMAEGYQALALKAQPQSRSAGELEFDRVLLLLRNRASDDAQFFANQLITADRVLIQANPNARSQDLTTTPPSQP